MARVLVVDDDPAALAFTAGALAGTHEVTACSCGRDAIAHAAATAYDVVLTDLGMPPPDGFEVVAALTALAAPPPVVVLTGWDRAASTLEAMRLGARDYLVKPATAEQIRAAV